MRSLFDRDEEALLEQLTGFHLHRGALAAMQRPELPGVAELLEGARTVAVLEDIVDHTNVGAMFRSAAALGVEHVWLGYEDSGLPEGDPLPPSSADP